ncbi:MAG: hypothetical protein JSU61_02660 [Fidelibacterota bacterium]|nr:MAG: hypothetical protein JSU61_02660 [Candidatus Neomarinimicrobiota bacterium]
MQNTTNSHSAPQTEREHQDRRQVDLALIFVHGDGRRFNGDRRRKSVPVTIERRSGVDRRDAQDRRGQAQGPLSSQHHLN